MNKYNWQEIRNTTIPIKLRGCLIYIFSNHLMYIEIIYMEKKYNEIIIITFSFFLDDSMYWLNWEKYELIIRIRRQ